MAITRLLLMFALGAPVAARADALPGWLAGHWVVDGETRVDEVWLAPRDGLMLGMSRTSGGGKPFFEFVRIEARADGVWYLAQPGGRDPPTAFRLVASDAREILFENPEHDFPQRVRYRRDGEDAIVATIEGLSKGKPRTETWRYRRER